MTFRPTDYFEPSTPEDVCGLLSQYGKHARVISGGTAIYELAKRGLADEVKQLISLRNVPLNYVRRDEHGLHVGSTMTLAELSEREEIRNEHSLQLLLESLQEIRPIQVKTVATVGGEICTSLPLLDFPSALLAVDAHVIIQGPKGRRSMALGDFLVDFFLNALESGEFLIETLIPKQPKHSGSAFMKFGRTAYDFNLVNVATRLTITPNEICSDSRIFLGGVGRVPVRATSSEGAMRQQRIDESAYARASEALDEFKAIPQIHGSPEYKRDIARVLVRNCLSRAAERAILH